MNKSLKTEKIVHGITVKKLPIGAYVEALEKVAQLPSSMMEKLFPEKVPAVALSGLARLGKEDTLKLFCKALTIVPNELINFFASLLDTDSDYIKYNLTPLEFIEVITEFWEINKIENFIKQVKVLVMSTR